MHNQMDAHLTPLSRPPHFPAACIAASQLEGLDRDTWYIFERVAITKDLYTGGGRTFLSNDDAREFRALIYQQYGGWRQKGRG